MIITMFRSSSFGRWDFCQQCYFGEYGLGLTDKSGKAASKGTCVHKVMEILANLKEAEQSGEKYFNKKDMCHVVDEIAGRLFPADMRKESFINSLVDKVYAYYSTKHDHLEWKRYDYNDVKRWTKQALSYSNGEFDPRNQNIVKAEPKFNFEIEQPWAMYNYTFKGEKLSGFLRMKGSIDLVVRENEDTLHIIDYKTGAKPYDWNKDKDKTQADFYVDPQVRIYHYACKHLFPNVKNFLVTVYYIRTENPFTVCLTDNDIPQTEKMIRERFEEIKNCKEPRLNRSWKCRKLCSQRHTFKGSNVVPIKEFRPNRVASVGETMTMCDQVNLEINRRGIDWVTENMANPNFTLGQYDSPGE